MNDDIFNGSGSPRIPLSDSLSHWFLGGAILLVLLFFGFLLFDSFWRTRLIERHLRKDAAVPFSRPPKGLRINRPQMVSFFLPIITVLIATIARLLLNPLLGQTLPFTLYFPSILVASRLGGVWSGIAACALSVVGAAYFWISPGRAQMIHASNQARIGVFLCAALMMVFFDRWTLARKEPGPNWTESNLNA